MHQKNLNHKGDFYRLNCLNSFRTKNNLMKESHEKAGKVKDFCKIVLPSEKNKRLKFNQYTKSDKILYIIYADLECLIKKNR